eukprot:gene47490-biopygen34485
MMDLADLLQDIPIPDGRRFTVGNKTIDGGAVPLESDALVSAWKDSEIFKMMLLEMDEDLVSSSTKSWPAVSSFTHCLESEYKLMIRNTSFLVGRVGQNVFVGIVAGMLFNTLAIVDSNSASDILCFVELIRAFMSFVMMPLISEQLAVFCSTYVTFSTLSIIVNGSVGLSDDYHGSRFFTFMFAVLVFSLSVTQFFRLLAGVLPSAIDAQPLAAIVVMLMILFSGFIVPRRNIFADWEWFYHSNPNSNVLSAVTTDELLAPE